MTDILASIIIITYKRALTLRYVLEGLTKQTCRDFEVIVVIKQPDEETIRLIEHYNLPIKIVVQKTGFAPEAFDMGLKVAKGKIIAFLDDDALPSPNWLQEHLKSYEESNEIGGVAGIDTPARIAKNQKVVEVEEPLVNHARLRKEYLKYHYLIHPLTTMPNWLTFFGKDGLAHYDPKFLLKDELQTTKPSLLFLGANMSVRKEAIEGVRISEFATVTSFLFEQHLSYRILRRGYKIIYNPRPRILHIVHEESLGRFFHKPSSAAIRDAEYILSFYTLKLTEPEVKWSNYIVQLFFLIIGRILGARKYGFVNSIYRVYGLLYGFTIGALLDEKSVRHSLTRIFSPSR